MGYALTLRLPAQPENAPLARRRTMAFLRSLKVCTDSQLHDLEAALGEGIANAIEHGSTGEPWFEVRCSYEKSGVIVEIEDFGKGFERRRSAHTLNESESGRGIPIIFSTADEVTYLKEGRMLRFRKLVSPTVAHAPNPHYGFDDFAKHEAPPHERERAAVGGGGLAEKLRIFQRSD